MARGSPRKITFPHPWERFVTPVTVTVWTSYPTGYTSSVTAHHWVTRTTENHHFLTTWFYKLITYVHTDCLPWGAACWCTLLDCFNAPPSSKICSTPSLKCSHLCCEDDREGASSIKALYAGRLRPSGISPTPFCVFRAWYLQVTQVKTDMASPQSDAGSISFGEEFTALVTLLSQQRLATYINRKSPHTNETFS